MSNPSGFSFGGQSASSSAPPKSIFGGFTNSSISSGGSFPPSTPAGEPPLGLFGSYGPVVTGSTFGIPHPDSSSNQPVKSGYNMGPFGSSSGIGSSSFPTTGWKGFDNTQVKHSGVAACPVPSTSNSNTARASAIGLVPPIPALSNSNNIATPDIRNMFSGAFNTKNAAPSGGLFGTPPTTNTSFIFTNPQAAGGSNAPSVFAAAGNSAPAVPPMTSIFGKSGQPVFAPAQIQKTPSPMGGQSAQPASVSVGRPPANKFGAQTTPAATPVATGNISQSIFPPLPPPTNSRPAVGPTVFSPPPPPQAPTMGIFAATISVAPSISPIPLSAQVQFGTQPTSVSSSTAPLFSSTPTFPASSTTPLFPSPAIPTTSIFTSTAPSSSIFPPVSSSTEATKAQCDFISPCSEENFPPSQKPSRLNYNTSLESIISRWTSDIENYKSEFNKGGLEINRCDTILFEHFKKIGDLVIEVTDIERKECTINRMLDQLGDDQEHLEKLLDYYEASLKNIEKERPEIQPVDEEREKVLQTVLTLNDKLSMMATGAGDMIKALNDASAKLENTTNMENPLFPIVKILNDHLSVMQWVDAQTTTLAEKINSTRTKTKVRPPDIEGDEAMRRYHSEHINTSRI